MSYMHVQCVPCTCVHEIVVINHVFCNSTPLVDTNMETKMTCVYQCIGGRSWFRKATLLVLLAHRQVFWTCGLCSNQPISEAGGSASIRSCWFVVIPNRLLPIDYAVPARATSWLQIWNCHLEDKKSHLLM